MAKKKNSFTGLVGSKGREQATNPDLTVDMEALDVKSKVVKKTVEKTEQSERRMGGTKPIQNDRVGKQSISAFVEKNVKKQFAMLSVETEKNQTELLNEALNDLFVKYGKPRIA